MPPVKLQPVSYRPDPARHVVIDCREGFPGPYMRGEGDDHSVCGLCGHVLIEGVIVAYLTLYICCPGCGTYNLTDGQGAASV